MSLLVKIGPLLTFAVLFTALTPTVRASTLGFSGSCLVDSVTTSDRKIVFILNGPCELLIDKAMDSSGSNAQIIKADLNHGVLVLYRTGEDYPTETAWQSECKFCKDAVGSYARLEATSATYTWKDGDLTFIQTDHLRIGIGKD